MTKKHNIFNFEVYNYVLAEKNDKDIARTYAKVYSSVDEYIQDTMYEFWED